MSINNSCDNEFSENSFFPCGGCPIENITGVWRFQRPPFFKSSTSSIPGHLLHYVLSGSYKLKIRRKQYFPEKGDILYYYGSEEVIWSGNDSYVDFYSVGFIGTSIPVLSAEERIIKTLDGMDKKWNKLWEVSRNPDIGKVRPIVYSILLDIIASIFWKSETPNQLFNTGGKWQKIEKLIRSRRLYHLSPNLLAEMAGLSKSSLYNVCRQETGTTPLQRLIEIRTEEARGLLKYTDMRIGEISDFLGYSRIHDFSREYKKVSGISPSAYRQNSIL